MFPEKNSAVYVVLLQMVAIFAHTNKLDIDYEQYNIEIPNVYQYVKRTGCMGCPYGSYAHDTEKELSLLRGGQKKFVCEYFKESYKGE